MRILLSIQRHGSISGAARTLGYTPAAVSQQLAKLEREVGTPLVQRHARGVTLTEAGEAIVDAGADIERRLVRLASHIEGISGAYTAKLRIATFQSAAAGFLPQALSRLRADYPDLTVEFAQVTRNEALKRLRQRSVDIAFIHTHDNLSEWHPEPDLQIELLLRDPMLLVVSTESEMASWPEPVDLRRLDGQNLIIGKTEDDDRAQVDRMFEELEVVPSYVAEIGEYFVAGAMASSGIAATLIPELAIPPGYRLTSKRILQDLERTVFMAIRKESQPAVLRAFCDILVSSARRSSKSR